MKAVILFVVNSIMAAIALCLCISIPVLFVSWLGTQVGFETGVVIIVTAVVGGGFLADKLTN